MSTSGVLKIYIYCHILISYDYPQQYTRTKNNTASVVPQALCSKLINCQIPIKECSLHMVQNVI